jgi:small subunit ribosomal protein S6
MAGRRRPDAPAVSNVRKEEPRLRSYETAIIYNSSLSEADLEQELARVVEFIGKGGGAHAGTQKWGRRMLAYPLKKQTEGVYFFVRWNGTSEVSASLDWNLGINDNCLRHLTLKLDESGGAEVIPESDDGGAPDTAGAEYPDGYDSDEESEQDSEE